MSIDRVLRHSRDCPQSLVLLGCLDRGVYEYRPGPKTFQGLSTVHGTPGVTRLERGVYEYGCMSMCNTLGARSPGKVWTCLGVSGQPSVW